MSSVRIAHFNVTSPSALRVIERLIPTLLLAEALRHGELADIELGDMRYLATRKDGAKVYRAVASIKGTTLYVSVVDKS